MTGPSELYSFLIGCVTDRGAISLRSLADFAQKNRDTEFKIPSFAALVCWGEVGLKEIRKIAVADPTSKNVSAALKMLSSVASGEELSDHLMFLHHEPLSVAIREAQQRSNLQGAARQQLAELILSLSADDLLIPLGTAFVQISIANGGMAEELVAALSAKWLHFGPPSLLQYEDLLLASPSDERSFTTSS